MDGVKPCTPSVASQPRTLHIGAGARKIRTNRTLEMRTLHAINGLALQHLLDHAPDGVFVHDTCGRILAVNQRSCTDLGYTRSELLALRIDDISCGATPQDNARAWSEAVVGEAVTLTQTAQRKDGSVFPVEIRMTCQLVDGQKLFLGFARDLSEREAARAALARLHSALEERVEARTRDLRAARDLLQNVMDGAQDGILFQDRLGRYEVLNRPALQWLGQTQDQAIGKTAHDMFPVDIAHRIRDAEARVMATGLPSTAEERMPVGGIERVFVVTRTPLRDTSGEVTGLVSVVRETTEQHRHELQIRQEHGRLALATQVAGMGVWDYDLVRDRLECDVQWYRIMGRDPSHPIHTVAEFRAFIHPEDVDRATEVQWTVAQLVTTGELYGIEFRIIHPDGTVRWVRSAACLIDDLHGAPQRAVGFVIDVTESRQAGERLQQRNRMLELEKDVLLQRSEALARASMEDALTGIANRRRLDQALSADWLHSNRMPRPIALALIDIDFFKRYNDRYGHPQGDATLKAVANLLATLARRPHDLVARYGGEEFVMLLPGDAQPELVLQTMTERLAQLGIVHDDSPIGPHLTVSCGCVIASRLDGLDARTLLQHSDQALYRAKARGRNRVEFTRL
jgi:diguanylate cyclase (GGDEF)-like protein/PAS domain S-box-containing protein